MKPHRAWTALSIAAIAATSAQCYLLAGPGVGTAHLEPGPRSASGPPVLVGVGPGEPAAAPSIAVPATEPPDAPAPLVEPSYEEVRELAVPVRDRAVEVLVLRGREPVSGATVRAGRVGVPTESTVLGSARTGVEGTARIPVHDCGTFWLETELEGATPRRADVIVDRFGSRRMVVVFGGASVEGRAFEEDGSIASGRALELAAALIVGSQQRLVVAADSAGAFELHGLSSGSWILNFEGDRNSWVYFDLKPGATMQVDLGSEGLRAAWNGCVRYIDGTCVDAAKALWFMRSVGTGGQGLLVESPDGRFQARLRPGEWTVRIDLPGRDWVPAAAPLNITESAETTDIALAGGRVAGYVHDAEDGQSVTLRTRGETSEFALSVHLDDDGRFCFEGVPAGVYEILGAPAALVDRTGRPPLAEIREDGHHLAFDLHPRRP